MGSASGPVGPALRSNVEIRQVFELEDFGPSDAIEHHRRLQEQIEKR